MNEMNLKQLQDDKFEWVNTRSRLATIGNLGDVAISLIKVGKNDKAHDGISIVFRNGVEEKVGDNLEIAIYKNRVLFRQTDTPAMAMLKNRDTNNRYGRITGGAIVQKLKAFIGDYTLKHDEFYELYYIEKETK